ncbi:MAG: CRISPR-associated endonuclease Cas6 [candidate division WOR-3 bacterium]|nr:CRISPR-associated endonuclease Cas6 [candidate division WOR-3 bacterium]
MKIKVLIFQFSSDRPIVATPDKIRGFFARRFSNYSIFHQHGEHILLYRFPLIQYKIIHKMPLVVGVNDGAKILQDLFVEIEDIEIGTQRYHLVEKNLIFRTEPLGITDSRRGYTFLTPWLALNERNYELYQRFGSRAKRRVLLEKILIGNILAMSKGLGYTVTAPLQVEIERFFETRTTLKGTPMLGFLGNFRVNFDIPEYLGLGKSVSRGFGTVGRVQDEPGDK